MSSSRTDRAGKLPFVIMIKPAGSICNMRCDYCYYLDTAYRDGKPAYRMTDAILETLIRSYIEAVPGPVVSFTWHGGEPAVCGPDFFRKAVSLQKQYLPDGWTAVNNLQTNGTLLDEAFCDFLAEEHFDVGLSIDGTRAVHDANRHMADGSPSYEHVLAAACRLLDRGIRPDLLCTVNAVTLSHARDVYRTLRDLKTGWIQFIPIVNQDGAGGITADSITPEGYGEFLKDVFAEWFFHDMGTVNVQMFAEMAKVLAGGEASLCTMAPVCGNVLVAEHDGGIYSCDHFVDAAHYLGNLEDTDLQTLLKSRFQQTFGLSKQDTLTAMCRTCPFLKLCSGGCLKDRFGRSPEGETGHNWLCTGLLSFYRYAVPLLTEAIRLSSLHVPGPQIRTRLIQAERSKYQGIGRNDPCPCGSGRKFKVCCARRIP